MRRKKYGINNSFLILGFLLVSAILLFVNERWIEDEFLNNLIMTLAISGITTGIFSFLSFLIEKKDVMEILKSSFCIINKTQKYGLKDIDKGFPFDDEKIASDFVESKTIYILMNDGKNFFSSQTELLKKRYSVPDFL